MSRKHIVSWLGLSFSAIVFLFAGCSGDGSIEGNNDPLAGSKGDEVNADESDKLSPPGFIETQIPLTASCYPPYNPDIWDCCFVVNNAIGHNYCRAMPLSAEYATTSDTLATLKKKYRYLGAGELIMKIFEPEGSLNVSCTDVVSLDENSDEKAIDCHVDNNSVQVPEGKNLLVRIKYDYGTQPFEDILAGKASIIRNSNVFYVPVINP